MSNASIATHSNTTDSTSIDTAFDQSNLHQFQVFVAGGERQLASSEDFAQAEFAAQFFADFLRVKTEVFDSVKDICYYAESVSDDAPITQSFALCGQKIKAANKRM